MSGNKGELNLTWVTSPPIVKLARYEIKLRVEQLKANLAGWAGVAVPTNPTKSDTDPTDWKVPQRTQQERWNIRLNSTNMMLDAANQFDGDEVVEYRVVGQPIGIMAIKFARPLYIEALVCHPGSADAGGILIEYAVNLAVTQHNEPRVKLSALDDEAKQVYLKLGFRSLSTMGSSMELDAANSSGVWKNMSDGWRLAKYAARGGFAA